MKTIKNTGLLLLCLCAGALLRAGQANAEVYEMADASGDLVGAGKNIISSYEDTFIDIGRLHNLGYEELRIANPEIDPWLPGEGSVVFLPTEFILPAGARQGIVINIAEYRIYYFYQRDGKRYVSTMPASIGRMDWATPLGATGIVAKVHKPSWYPPESVREEHAADGRPLPRIVPPGPDNPLGDYALRLGLPGYLIHGTNRPSGVGMRVTHGCIRLFPEDIAWLFPQVTLQTPVLIVNQPLKFGWKGDDLFLEVHPVLESAETNPDANLITHEYVKATRDQQAVVDWELIARVYKEQRGIPVMVGGRVANDTAVPQIVGQADMQGEVQSGGQPR